MFPTLLLPLREYHGKGHGKVCVHPERIPCDGHPVPSMWLDAETPAHRTSVVDVRFASAQGCDLMGVGLMRTK